MSNLLAKMEEAYYGLTGTSEYRSWKRKYKSAADALELYWQKLMLGQPVAMPNITNAYGRSLALMVSLFPPVPAPAPAPTPAPEPVPAPEPSGGLSYPTNPMTPYFERGGLKPVASGNVWKCETTGAGLSRVFWDLSNTPYQKRIGDQFSISCKLSYNAEARGVMMRIENFTADMKNLNQLGLSRFREDAMFYVTQGLHPSSPIIYNHLISKIDIPSGSLVELRGKLSNIDGQALTILLVNGVEKGRSTRHNIEQDVEILRARFGFVDTDRAGVVQVESPRFG